MTSSCLIAHSAPGFVVAMRNLSVPGNFFMRNSNSE